MGRMLQDELDGLSKKIAGFLEPAEISDEKWRQFTANSVVALMAGGESSRYAAVLHGQKVNKNAHELPNGDTMIEMAIRMYRDAGIKKLIELKIESAMVPVWGWKSFTVTIPKSRSARVERYTMH